MSELMNRVKILLSKSTTRNYMWVFCGQTMASVLHLASLAILIYVLGHEGNGILLGVQAICYLCGDLTNPYSFLSVIKFLTAANSVEEKNKIVSQGFTLDVFAGVFGTIVAVLLMKPICSWLGYSSEITAYALLYLPSVYFRHVSTGTAMGILRYLGKFNVTIIIYDIQSVLRIVFYSLLLVSGGGIGTLIILEMILEVIYGFALITIAFIYSRKNNIEYPPKKHAHFSKDFLQFNLLNMASTTVDMALGNVSSLIISKYLGVSLLSVYKILEKIGSLTSKFTTPVSQIIYPNLCKTVTDKRYNKLIGFVKKYMLYVGSVSVFVIILCTATFPLWRGIFSLEPEYIFEVTLYIAFSMATCMAIPIHSIHAALGLMHYNLINVLIINTLYCIIIIPILNAFSLKGLIILLLAQAIVMMLVKWYQELRHIKRLGKEQIYE